jgi:hypothetical protein
MRKLLTCTLIALLAAPAASAQPPTRNTVEMWHAMGERLPAGAPVRIRLTDGSHFDGQLVQVAPDSITIKPRTRMPAPMRDVPLSRVDQIENRQPGMSPGAKVLIGVGIAGGVLMSMFVAVLAGGD